MCRCAAVQVEFYNKGSQKIEEEKRRIKKVQKTERQSAHLHSCTRVKWHDIVGHFEDNMRAATCTRSCTNMMT